MSGTRGFVVGLVILGLPALASAWGNCDARDGRQAHADAAGAKTVEVHAKAGSLEIYGEAGLNEVRAEGTACARNPEALEKVQLRAERSGSTVRVEVDIPDGWNQGGALDLMVRVPESVAVVVKDTSGEVEVKGVASLKLKDSSGDVDVKDIGGDLEIRDGSGSIEISHVAGSVVLEDGSGSIDVQDVTGNVTVESDGSGSITMQGVERDILVKRDGSGSIRVQDVGGDFIVEKDGSGSITHTGVVGHVDIPSSKR
jgi:DUF4097 and DUF4098 domain-containing protein YvlB